MAQTEISNKTGSKLFPPWPPLVAIFMVFAIFLGASILGETILVLYGLAQGQELSDLESWFSDSTVMQFLSGVLIYSLMAMFVYLFVRGYKVSLRALGLVKPRFKDIGIALLGVVPYIVGYIVLLVLAGIVFPSLDLEQEQQLGFQTTESIVGLSLIFISLVVFPPIVEELVMRGFLFTSMLGRLQFIPAALITSVIFAVAHLQFGSGAPLLWVAALDTFILSLVLCYMRYKTGSLWPCIFLHGLKNCVAYLSIFVFQIS